MLPRYLKTAVANPRRSPAVYVVLCKPCARVRLGGVMLLRFAVCVLGFLGGAVMGEARAGEKPAVEKVLQLGHSGTVRSVAFSPDGKTALSGSGDHTARLWDLATGREIRKFEGHSGEVSSVAFSPDGKT